MKASLSFPVITLIITLSSLDLKAQAFSVPFTQTRIKVTNNNQVTPYSYSSNPRYYHSQQHLYTTEINTKNKLYSKTKLSAASTAAATTESNNNNDGAEISSLTFNLVKSIVGAGVLSLPAGIAAFANAPSAIIPANILIAVIGGLSGYGFSLIGRVCAYTGSKSYREAWEKSIGKETSIIPAASCTFKTTAAILAYSMILADTFQSILATCGLVLTRSQTLLSVTSLILLPLCLLKNLASLAPFSLLGVVGMGYTTLAMAVRYFTKAYALPSGPLLASVPVALKPKFGDVGAAGVMNPNSFILICMLSTAYMAHFNAPKFYMELKNNTIKRYNTLVSTSFAASILLFMAVASMGFLTFGSNCSGLILNNYSTSDVLISLSRVAVAMSLVFSYPLAFAGCRDGVLDLAKVPVEKRSNSVLNQVTVAILSVVTGLALTVKDVSFVLSFGGATLGNALIYVYPALMFRGAVQKMGNKASKGLKSEVNFALGSATLGTFMGCIGAKMAWKAAFGG